MKHRTISHVFIATALILSLSAQAEPPASFSQAKKVTSQFYSDHQTTFYCGCDYHKVDGKLRTDLDSCGYTPRKNANRAGRVEWEHVVPAWWIGHQRQCWQDGGRKNCRKTDPFFRKAEADLYNLVPSIGEVNGDRSNYRFGMLEGEERRYGTCDFEIDFKQRVAEPDPAIRGDIARIYFYMSDTYNIRLSKQQQRLLEIWGRQDPVDDWERERKRRIAAEFAK
jgi:deoxyribonuclease-1